MHKRRHNEFFFRDFFFFVSESERVHFNLSEYITDLFFPVRFITEKLNLKMFYKICNLRRYWVKTNEIGKKSPHIKVGNLLILQKIIFYHRQHLTSLHMNI